MHRTKDGHSTIADRAAEPIDRDHLRRYTFGDDALEHEVLALFREQAMEMLAQLRQAGTEKDWHFAAHSLKGSARGIGAHALEQAARAAELAGERALAGEADVRVDHLQRVEAALSEVESFIDAHWRMAR